MLWYGKSAKLTLLCIKWAICNSIEISRIVFAFPRLELSCRTFLVREISHSSLLELRCLCKVRIHRLSLLSRNPEEGRAWRKQWFPTFHYLHWIFSVHFLITNTSCLTLQKPLAVIIASHALEKYQLEPLDNYTVNGHWLYSWLSLQKYAFS